jgi:hypothetical protein
MIAEPLVSGCLHGNRVEGAFVVWRMKDAPAAHIFSTEVRITESCVIPRLCPFLADDRASGSSAMVRHPSPTEVEPDLPGFLRPFPHKRLIAQRPSGSILGRG